MKRLVKINGGTNDKDNKRGCERRKTTLNGISIERGNEIAKISEIMIKFLSLKFITDARNPPIPNPSIATDNDKNT